MNGSVAWVAMDRPTAPRTLRGVVGGAFGWVVAAYGLSSLAFFAFYGTVFTQAAYEHGAGPGQTAILGVALSVPFILGSLLQGVVVDRWSPKWLSILGYAGAALAIVVAWVGGSLGALYGAAFLLGISFATIEPARSSMTGLLIAPDDLVRANGVMTISFQCALALGSLAGGVLLDAAGAGVVYGFTLAVAIFPIICMLPVPDVRARGDDGADLSLDDLRTGFRTAVGDRSLRLLLIVTALGWTLVNTFFVLEPIFVRDVLHRPDASLLYLWAAHGLGAVTVAALFVLRRRSGHREPLFVCLGVAAIGAGMFLYAVTAIYAVALPAAALQGAGFSLMLPLLFAFIQREVVADQRGRVTGLFVAVQEAMGLVSSLVILAAGDAVPVQATLVVGGVGLAVLGSAGARIARAAPIEAIGDA
jgi:MFS family permease